MECRIFYSWQKNLPGGTNRSFIEGELEAVAKALTADDEVVVDTILDRDTAGVAGSPDIGQTIFKKIDAATVFVCDVSIINSKAPDKRKAPNPNVLVELGYALKALGWARVLMVMNTAYGPPELLPFDLKQKRAMTYDLQKGAPKEAARKLLRRALTDAIKLIVTEHQAALVGAEPAQGSIADTAIEAIRAGRRDQGPRVKEFMQSLTEQLVKLDPHTLPGDTAENLVKAIAHSRPLVDEFGQVAQVAAENDSKEAVLALVAGFEYVLARYNPPPGFSGSFREVDFDLFRFAGHELFTVLVGQLVRAGRWPLVGAVSSEKLYWRDPQSGPGHVGVDVLSEQVRQLDFLSRQRKLLSLHADLLKERHDGPTPAGGVGLEDFLAADLLLFVALYERSSDWPAWHPRSSVYLQGRPPRFLLAAAMLSGSRNLASALGMSDLAAMKAHVTAAFDYLNKSVSAMAPIRPGARLNAEQIATS